MVGHVAVLTALRCLDVSPKSRSASEQQQKKLGSQQRIMDQVRLLEELLPTGSNPNNRCSVSLDILCAVLSSKYGFTKIARKDL